MEHKQSKRIQTSVLNGIEKKALVAIANRLPLWVTSDMLTLIGTIGAVIIAVGYLLSSYDINFLWLASFGLLVNWYGDSLDGTIARVRNIQRPVYGFFIDHMMDCFNETIMFVGIGLSPLLDLRLSLLVLVFYLLLSVYVYISSQLKCEFKLTYAKMGPTEFRALVVIVNTLVMYVTPLREFSAEFSIFGMVHEFTIFDIVAVLLIVLLAILLLVSFIHDAREYAKIDPPKKNDPSDK